MQHVADRALVSMWLTRKGGGVRWPWKVAGDYVHLVTKCDEGRERLLCTWVNQTRSLVDMDGGEDIVAALSSGLRICKRCIRGLPWVIRDEALSLASEACILCLSIPSQRASSQCDAS